MLLENINLCWSGFFQEFCQNLFASHVVCLEYGGTELHTLLAVCCSWCVFRSACYFHLSCSVCRNCSDFFHHSGLGSTRSVFQQGSFEVQRTVEVEMRPFMVVSLWQGFVLLSSCQSGHERTFGQDCHILYFYVTYIQESTELPVPGLEW